MDNIFKELLNEKKSLEDRAKHIEEAVEHLRAICEHQWHYGGSDSHNDWEKCERCGERRRI
jgi:hypothetical protein